MIAVLFLWPLADANDPYLFPFPLDMMADFTTLGTAAQTYAAATPLHVE
jgi:hypothetical protein